MVAYWLSSAAGLLSGTISLHPLGWGFETYLSSVYIEVLCLLLCGFLPTCCYANLCLKIAHSITVWVLCDGLALYPACSPALLCLVWMEHVPAPPSDQDKQADDGSMDG